MAGPTHNLYSQMGGHIAAVTPSNTTEQLFNYLYIGGAGNVAIQDVDGNTVTFSACPAGSYVWARGIKVMSTNTTATLILAIR